MRVVCGIPAGRREYLRVLIPHLLAQRGVDEFQLWVNTESADDVAFIQAVCDWRPDKFTRVNLPFGATVDGVVSIRHFFRLSNDLETIYIKLDDDICWMHPDCLETLIAYRKANPEHFLVYSNVVNNNICTHIHQRMGLIPHPRGLGEPPGHMARVAYFGYDYASFADMDLAREIHRSFQHYHSKGNEGVFMFDEWIDWEGTRICINLISWFGADMPQDGADFVEKHDEIELSERIPKATGRTKAICGRSLAVHYAYSTQRAGLPHGEFLDWYQGQSPSVQLPL